MSLDIQRVQPIDEDGLLIMKWRNDPLTRKNSFNQEEKVWTTFKDEFYNNYFNNIPLFVTYDGEKIAFLSFIFTENDHELIIGINISPEYRGKKLSTAIICLGVDYIRKTLSEVTMIIAKIKEDNIASYKAFTRAGFQEYNKHDGIIYTSIGLQERGSPCLISLLRCLPKILL